MKRVSLHDTATKSISELRTLEPGKVRIYSCGPTVYGRQHLGNLRTYVFTDLLRRTLEHFGYAVRHVINVTDVGHLTDDASDGEDKLENAARRGGERALDVAARWFRIFRQDLARLSVRDPTLYSKATEHIAEQIDLARILEARGFTYRTADGLYFDTSRDPGYGKLAGLAHVDPEHSRIAGASDKRNAADFALWKLSPTEGPPRQLEWESPWGVGFPGWHLECSAMATKHLGTQLDIHTGGVDHVPVHHVNEIAQSENAFDARPWAGRWMHAAWLYLEGEKISKSAGRAPSLDDLAALGIEPAAFRYYLSTAHYRAPLSLELDAVRAARTAWLRLARFVEEASGTSDDRSTPHPRVRATENEIDEALADDLDVPRAIAALWKLQRDGEVPAAQRARTIGRLASTLGLDLDLAAAPAENDESARAIDALVAERDAARARGDYARADALRHELVGLGVHLDDTKGGARRRRA